MYVISGNPDEVTEQIEAFATIGVRHMQINFLDFPRTDGLDLFLADVLPASPTSARNAGSSAEDERREERRKWEETVIFLSFSARSSCSSAPSVGLIPRKE